MSTETPQLSANSKAAGFFYAALAAALWALITPFSRLLFTWDVSPMEIAFWRTLIGGLCFTVVSLCTRSLFIPARDAVGMLVIGGLIGSLMFGSFQTSIELCGGATAVVLLYTAPAWVAVFSRIIFKEAISGTKLAAMGIAMAGVVLIGVSGGSMGGEFSAKGIACGLLCGFTYAAYFPYTVWYGRKYPTQTLYGYAFLGSALLLLPFTMPRLDWPALVWGTIAVKAVLTHFLSYLALGASLKRITQVQSAVIGNVEPVLGIFLVWWLFDENFSATGWAGCALIMLAVLVLTLEKKKKTA